MSLRKNIRNYIIAKNLKRKTKIKPKSLGFKYAEQTSGNMGKFNIGENNLYFNGGSAEVYDKQSNNPKGIFYFGRLGRPMTVEEIAKMKGKDPSDAPEGSNSWEDIVMKDKVVSSTNIGFIEPITNLLTNTNVNNIPNDERFFFIPPQGNILEDVRCKVYIDEEGRRRINLVGPLLKGISDKGDAIVSIAMYDGDWEDGPSERKFVFKEVCSGQIENTDEKISVKNPQNPFKLNDRYYMLVRSMRPEEMKQIWITKSTEDKINSIYKLIKKLPGLDENKFPKGFQRIAISSNQIEGINLETIYPKKISSDFSDKKIFLQLIHYVTRNEKGHERYKVGVLITSINKNTLDIETLKAEGVGLNILGRKNYPKPIRDLPSFLPDKEEIALPVASCSPIISPFNKKPAYLISGGLEDCVLGSFIIDKRELVKIARVILDNKNTPYYIEA